MGLCAESRNQPAALRLHLLSAETGPQLPQHQHESGTVGNGRNGAREERAPTLHGPSNRKPPETMAGGIQHLYREWLRQLLARSPDLRAAGNDLERGRCAKARRGRRRLATAQADSRSDNSQCRCETAISRIVHTDLGLYFHCRRRIDKIGDVWG